MDKTETVLWGVVSARADDDSPKLLLAKWLDDRADSRGDCLRWVAAEHKRPAFDRIDTKTWDWWSRTPADPLHYDISPREYLLPLNLFTRLTPFGPGLWKGKSEFLKALQDLCSAWYECVQDKANPLDDNCLRPELDAGLAADGGPGV